MRTALVLAGALIAIGWGIAHVVPTRRVVAGFGPISPDNRRILTMEWIAEGLSLAFVGALALLVELAGAGSAVVVLRACAAMLLAMAALTAATGARTAMAVFKACPFVKASAALLLLLASGM